jgi:hypothetical protein
MGAGVLRGAGEWMLNMLKYSFYIILLLLCLGAQKSNRPTSPLEIKWKLDMEGSSMHPPLDAGELLIWTSGARVFAVNKLSGVTVWETALHQTLNAPVLHGNRIVLTSAGGTLYCLQMTGAIDWQVECGPTHRAPLSLRGIVTLGFDGKLKKFNDTGKVLWELSLEGKGGWQMLSVSNSFVAVTAEKVYRINAVDGKLIWVLDRKGSVDSHYQPILIADRILVPDVTAVTSYSIDGKHLGGLDVPEGINSSRCIAKIDQNRWCLASAKYLYIFDADKQLWKASLGPIETISTPIVLGKEVWCSSFDGAQFPDRRAWFSGWNEAGQPIGQIDIATFVTGGYSINDRMYINTADSLLFALKRKK